MQQHLRDFFVYRICAGYLKYDRRDLILRILPPTDEILYEASIEYLNAYNNALESGIATYDQIIAGLIEANIWNDVMQKDLDKFPEQIDNLKVGLLKYIYKPIEREKLRKILNDHRTEYSRLVNIRHSWDHATCEGAASMVKWQYIIENTTINPDGSKYEWDKLMPMDILGYYQENVLNERIMRELARTEPWGSLWAIKKKNGKIFNEPFSYEQRSLVMWSITYDIVHESPDCPQDEIIEDDDMLDGWFISQKRKRKQEKSKEYADELVTNKKIANSDEIFIVARSPEELEHINALNDVRGEIVRKQRLHQVKKQGEVPFIMFKDMQDRLRMEATQKLSQHYNEGKK